MVTARLAIGSVSTLALGALLLGSAPYWLSRSAGGSHGSPWGAVSALGSVSSTPATSEGERAQLLKLAALKSGTAPEPASALVASAPPADPVPMPQPVVQMDVAAAPPVPAADPSTPVPVSTDAPQQMASAEAPALGDAATDDNGAKSDRININTALPSVLDHLPGAGRIGHTIVSHRPYKNVKDLVSRRILRTSDFQKIQSRISVD